MRTLFYISIMLLSSLLQTLPVTAQSCVNFEAAQVFSNFKYVDSKGIEDNTYTYKIGNAFGLGYQYTSSNGFFARASLGMRKAGANLIYNNIRYIWSLQYSNLQVGIGYQYNEWRLKPYIAVMPYYAYLLDANQTIDSDNYDIKANKSIKNSDFGLFIAPGFNITITKYISVFAEYKYIMGLQNIESAQGEQLFNRGFALNFGIALYFTRISRISLPRMQ